MDKNVTLQCIVSMHCDIYFFKYIVILETLWKPLSPLPKLVSQKFSLKVVRSWVIKYFSYVFWQTSEKKDLPLDLTPSTNYGKTPV